MRAFTPRTVALIVVAAIAIEALAYLIDVLPWDWMGAVPWLLLILLGPLATGVVFGYLRKPWLLAAATWALAGILSLLTDWIFLNEDQVFHLAQTIVMVIVVAIGTAIGRGIRRLLRGETAARTPVR
jgi:hypothetical protein